MHLDLVLQQSRPVLLLGLSLLQHHLDFTRVVVETGLFGLNLGVKIQLDFVVYLYGRGVAGEFEVGGLDVQFHLLGVDIWHGDCEEDDVLLGLSGGRALGPEDFYMISICTVRQVVGVWGGKRILPSGVKVLPICLVSVVVGASIFSVS